jgi:outer membrane murein-binding lipoprotein Lpp
MNTKRLITLALGCVALACPVLLAAQDSQESVADAARKAQAAKKNAPPAKMVLDNDTLDTLKTGDNSAKPAAKGSGADEAYWRQKFADANRKLADDSHELDITQRERNLKQQQYYADPMQALKQDYSRQDLNDAKAKIDDLTAKVAQDKADISQLEDELRQAGGDPGWASQPSQSAPPSGSPDTSQPAPAPAPAPAAQPATPAPTGQAK